MGINIAAPARNAGDFERMAPLNDELFASLKRNERLVYNALLEAQSPLKAYDLLDDLQDQGLRAPMTIYRALESLTAKGLVKKIATINAFVAVRPGRKAPVTAFVICRKCQQAKEITVDDAKLAGIFAPETVAAGEISIEAFADCINGCEGSHREAS